MMQSFPFTSQVTYDSGGIPIYDRAVDSEILRNVLKNYYNNGVFALNNSDCFLVEAPSEESMVVTVLPGACLISGATAYDKQETELTLNVGGSMDRIDTIVLRFNDNVSYRNISLAIVEGTPATTPSAPTLTRTDSVYELGIADILVPANSSAVAASRITDTRQNSERCGYVSAIQTLDVTSIFNQYQAALDEYLEIVAEALDETLAGHLQNEIDDLDDEIDGLKTETAFTISTSGWSNSQTLVDGVDYYTYLINLTDIYTETPVIGIGAVGTLPTEAEQEAYDSWQYATVNNSNNTLTLYAIDKPTSNFKIIVKGVA